MRIADAFDPAAIDQGADIIARGGLVAFATETVYGLGADACNPLAVARIFEVKRRPSIDPIIVHVADPESAELYAHLQNGFASALMRHFWPGPLTLVVPKKDTVPSIVTAGLGTVGVRMPAPPAALALIRAAGRAIAAPSANPFGYVSPTEASHVSAQLGRDVDLVLDGGPCSVGVESTIVSLIGDQPVLLRAGGITAEEIIKVIGGLKWATGSADRPLAPGQLTRHYSTRTPLALEPDETSGQIDRGEKVGLLCFDRTLFPDRYRAIEVLSRAGNLREAASNLFSALHRLDQAGLDRIIALPVPETGLGMAIMDRLRRCAAK
jgi:L-threonylcarbamoyladenylate synthase